MRLRETNNCCFKCPDRYLGCHSECIKYIEMKNQLLIEHEKIRESKSKGEKIMGYFKDDKERRRQRH